MIERERQVSDGSDCDRILDDHRSFVDRANTQNRHLRLIDDGGSEDAAEAAKVGYRERSTLHFVRLQLARAGASGEVHDSALQARDILFVGIADHWHNQSVL